MSELMPVLLALTILIGGVAGAAILTWFERRFWVYGKTVMALTGWGP